MLSQESIFDHSRTGTVRQAVSHFLMARRRRFRKPLLPGLWTVLAAFVLIGSIGGLFWLLGTATKFTRVTPPAPTVAKGK